MRLTESKLIRSTEETGKLFRSNKKLNRIRDHIILLRVVGPLVGKEIKENHTHIDSYLS